MDISPKSKIRFREDNVLKNINTGFFERIYERAERGGKG